MRLPTSVFLLFFLTLMLKYMLVRKARSRAPVASTRSRSSLSSPLCPWPLQPSGGQPEALVRWHPVTQPPPGAACTLRSWHPAASVGGSREQWAEGEGPRPAGTEHRGAEHRHGCVETWFCWVQAKHLSSGETTLCKRLV